MQQGFLILVNLRQNAPIVDFLVFLYAVNRRNQFKLIQYMVMRPVEQSTQISKSQLSY